MNKMEIEVEDSLDSNEFFKEELFLIKAIKKDSKYLSLLAGIEIKGLKLKISNADKFVKYVLRRYFKGYKIIEYQFELGHPDYLLSNGEDKIYVELKLFTDSLRTSQLKWFVENKEKNNKLLFIKWENDSFPHKGDGKTL